MREIFDYFKNIDIDMFKKDLIEFWNTYSDIDENELTPYALRLRNQVNQFIEEIRVIK